MLVFFQREKSGGNGDVRDGRANPHYQMMSISDTAGLYCDPCFRRWASLTRFNELIAKFTQIVKR
jgi:hypothetical protein